MKITLREKWKAVIRCDKVYDGLFYYGVTTTGIFCRPSCNSKTPLKENVIFFENIESALKYGLRPCKRCRPDLIEYNPIFNIIEKAKYIYFNNYNDSKEIEKEIAKLPISTNHLIRIFKQEVGATPKEYLSRIRIEKATELLKTTELTVINIAFMCGFHSLSAFYQCFKKEKRLSPVKYKKGKV